MKRPQLVLAAIVACALALAWLIRFGTDDSYISYVYSRALVRGDGLTWFGAHVEGYTNFLWVLWVALGLVLGADPLGWAWAGSLAALAGALVVTWRVVQLRGGSTTAAACACGLLATNFTFVAYGTSGLETMLQAALLALAWWWGERLRREAVTVRRLAAWSVIAALALATRLDSAVVLAVVAGSLVRRLRGRAEWLAVAAPAAVLVGAWFGWKLAYYGDVLPNTFHAKVGITGASLAMGARYAGAFLHAYLWWPLLAAAAIVRRRFTLPWAIALAWFAYVIAVGGDFMEFRFFVPVMAMLGAIIADLVVVQPTPAVPRLPSAPVRAFAVVALLATWSWRHAAKFLGTEDASYDAIHMLGTFYGTVPDNDWARLGRPLHDALDGTGATLACNGAGAIPYYADLPTIDQLGLNDRWVAENGVRPSYGRPGHQRFATYDYLVGRGVTFVIGRPTLVPRGALAPHVVSPEVAHWLSTVLGPTQPPATASFHIVAAPVDDTYAMLLWYLTPSEPVTAAIERAGWEQRSLRAR
jgi:arabinofuranosyltransferase